MVLAFAALACPVFIASASAASGPDITAAPLIDLTNGSNVAIAGTGFVPGVPVLFGECSAIPGQCGNFRLQVASSTGTVATTLPATTTVFSTITNTTFSCVTESCFVITFQGSPTPTGAPFTRVVGIEKPLWFRNTSGDVADRSVVASPSQGLVDGQSVTVTGNDFYNGYTPVSECVVQPVLACAASVVAHADAAGSFTVGLTVQREFDALVVPHVAGEVSTTTIHVNCADPVSFPGGCIVAAAQGVPFTPSWTYATTPLSFVALAPSECKNDGWRTTSDDRGSPFKNQGDCVSFVASGGKNTAG